MIFNRQQLRKSFKPLVLALILTMSFVANTVQVIAIPDEDFYSSNDILFFDPDDNCGISVGKAGNFTLPDLPNPLDMKKDLEAVKKTIWDFLTAKGLSAEQTAGIMGNLQAESGFNPAIVEGGSGIGFGIAQWSYGRRTALEAQGAKQGINVSPPPTPQLLGFELEYLYQELTVRIADRPEYRQYKTEWEAIKKQKTVEDALVAFHHEFEVSHLMDKPDPRGAVIAARGGFANEIYKKYKGTSPNANAKECGGPTGNLEQTLEAYAWPEYRGLDITPKEAWQEVINTAAQRNRYIGGTMHPGIDCGGFTTNLIIDSGYDPNFNYGGDKRKGAGNTTAQLSWMQKNWHKLGAGGSFDAATLKPGDVAINATHTYVYVGRDINGGQSFKTGIASASWDERAPMAGTETVNDPSFIWYSKTKG